MADPIENDVEPRLVAPGGSAVRVVLAEADAPGSLHYLLEAEGFQVIGCAADEAELGRVLGQDLDPDVIVLDADITATSVLVARELAPEAHVVAVWPDDVLPPPGADRVSPALVYEELGPTIRRHMDSRVVPVVAPVPDVVLPSSELAAVGAAATAASGFALGRAASRLSVTSVTLLTAILLTMGVSFALGGFRLDRTAVPPKIIAPRTSTADGSETSDPITGRTPRYVDPTDGGTGGRPAGSSGHQHGSGGQAAPVASIAGGQGIPVPVDPGGGNQGNQGGSPGDQGGGSGGQGDQGGGQGDQGGGSGDQGGGGSGDQGDQGDQGGGGQGDQGQDSQGNQGGSQGDQGSQDQGDQGSPGGQHASQSDDQG